MYGKRGNRPRLSVYYDISDSNMPKVVVEMFQWVNARVGKLVAQNREDKSSRQEKVIFDSVLIHKYRHGDDYINWHADKEASDAYICAVSLARPASSGSESRQTERPSGRSS